MTTKTALSGVRVFDGERLSAPRTVIIDGGTISGSTDTAERASSTVRARCCYPV